VAAKWSYEVGAQYQYVAWSGTLDALAYRQLNCRKKGW
jgi:hypothetical protein